MNHSKLVRMRIQNLGCIGDSGLAVDLDDILCLVGANNSGKSTVLRAYELAVGNLALANEDRHDQAGELPTTVEIWVHIPEGTANIDEKWKEKDGEYLVVRSKWEWSGPFSPVRSTWDPEIQDYAPDGKASGLDTVFSSRLPKPFRIGSLDDPAEEHKKLLQLLIEPLAKQLDELLKETESDLGKALAAVRSIALGPVKEANRQLEEICSDVNEPYQEIFPDLRIDVKVDLADISFKPLDSLLRASQFKVFDGGSETIWQQQGTGSQRALFWSMLQVRSKLKAARDGELLRQKKIESISKEIAKLEKALATFKKPETVAQKRDEIDALREKLKEEQEKADSAEQVDDLALPGYMLLIDEPETALHPNAVRAARSSLYSLARDPGWQVMLSSHSPLFINPLEDHTTVVRLAKDGTVPFTRTYRSDSMSFSDEERENLKMLLRFDQGLAEMFFGAFPLIVEGDTELAAFEAIMSRFLEDYPLSRRPIVVRARGKEIITTIIRMLAHFKVNFGVLHDADSPMTRKGGKASPSWSANERIYHAILEARSNGVDIVHRVSVPDFERAHGLEERSEDKPWEVWKAIGSSDILAATVREKLDELIDRSSEQDPYNGDILGQLRTDIESWAKASGNTESRFVFG